jgi:hypothetical protein
MATGQCFPSAFATLTIVRSLLERFKIFTLIYHLTDLQSREDITIGFIERCSYQLYVVAETACN